MKAIILMVKKVIKKKSGDYEWEETDKGYAICEETSDRIQLSTDEFYFESEAYHLKTEAEANGYEYKIIEKEFDFDKEWDNA